MHTVIETLLFQHDLRIVALAGVICALASFAGISLLTHARRTTGAMQVFWLGVAAVSVGFGIWATHFIAMIAFAPRLPVGYEIGQTVLSLLVAITITGLGLWFAAIGKRATDSVLGGAIVGIGIAAMHYIGMSAIKVGGDIVWDPALIAISVLLGIGLGGSALAFATRSGQLGWRIGAAAMLTVAICAMHFTGMGAAGMQNCFAVVEADDLTRVLLIFSVAGASILILLLALGGLFLDLRDRRHAELEASRMRGMADAAVEGLIVVDNGIIVTVNSSFRALVGAEDNDLAGRPLAEFLGHLASDDDKPVEAELLTQDGARLPVEVIFHDIDFGGRLLRAAAIRDLSTRKKDEQHIRYLAHHDSLTGLPNRASFNRQLTTEIAHARRLSQSFAVLCLDLDRFKEVNDLFGHSSGDALLQRVGTTLVRTLGEGQTAARLGGDEFAVIIPDLQSAAQAGRLAEAMLDAFRAQNDLTNDGTAISASVGIAVFPDDAEDEEALMNNADTALYRAKQDGRGIYRFFESEMGAVVRDRRLIEHDLRHAISRNQLRLVYQPQVNIQSSRVTGFEALVRWEHPERGAVSPGHFIPIAEDSGLILQIGEWVLRSACTEAAGWTNKLAVAVNVSTVQIHHANFANTLAEILAQTGLAPERLEIEITETALVRDMSRAIATLKQIKGLGVRIAMDDFGTGYSSLANLRAFPFDKIKVDQSFIKAVDSNDQSAAIVRAVLGLGSGLDLPVIAEGVERPEELDFLRGEVCAEAQGYLLGRPADISVFASVTSGMEITLPGPTPRQSATALKLVAG